MAGVPTIMLSPSCEWPIEPPDSGERGEPPDRRRRPRAQCLRRLAASAAIVLVSFGLGAFADAMAFATPCRGMVDLTQSFLARLRVHSYSVGPLGRSMATADSTDAGASQGSGAAQSASQPVKALGATVATLTPEMRREIGLPDSVDGVVITELAFDGVAAQARLQTNDVIERIGDHAVTGPADLELAVRSMIDAKQSSLPLTINRGGVESAVTVRVGGN